MALSLATVGGKITATFMNLIVGLINRQGMTAIIPTSVAGTGVTLGSAGKITYSGSTSVSINGCFTAEFDNYQIIIDVATRTAATNLTARLRISGTDNSTATSYGSQQNYNNTASSMSSSFFDSSNWTIDSGGGLAAGSNIGPVVFNIFKPFVSGKTWGLGQSISASASSAIIGANTFMVNDSTLVADGITISVASGTFSGSIRIYGYNNN